MRNYLLRLIYDILYSVFPNPECTDRRRTAVAPKEIKDMR